MGKRAPITLRINPDVDAKTHAKITTGTAETKFGIPFAHAREVYAHAATLKASRSSASMFISAARSPNCSPSRPRSTVWRTGRRRCAPTAMPSRAWIWAAGWACPMKQTTVRRPIPRPMAPWSARVTRDLGCRLIFEPGRLIAANAGVLVSRVIYVKHGEARHFLIIDAGMNDLIRPAMYDACHEIVPVREPAAGAAHASMTWSGRYAKPPTFSPRAANCRNSKSGDLVAILTAGAYGAVMAVDLQCPAAGAGSLGSRASNGAS